MVTPESVGIDSRALQKLMERLSKFEYLNSMIIQRHGQRCMECWVKPYTRNVPHQLFSLSKSFTSVAIGLAQAEGKLNIHDKLIGFFPEYEPCITDARMKQATLEDLLTMRSGHLTAAECYCKTSDWVHDYLASPLDTEPGKTFTYNSAATYMLAAVIKRVTGENVREYLLPRLFVPLAITPGIWESCPKGINYGGWGLYLKTDDIAKFAQLLLQHGEWQGKQLLPREYLAQATRKQSDNSMNDFIDWQQGYGYQFWCSTHGYRGDGASGQYAIMLEEEDIAIAVTGCMPNMGDILTVLWEDLLPGLADQALPENPSAQQKLDDFLEKMAIPVSTSPYQVPAGFRDYSFKDNPAKIKRCNLAWNDSDCTLTFTKNGVTEELRAGFGTFENSTFQLTDARPHPVAATAAWLNEHTLEIRSFITDGIYRDVWTIDLEDAAEPVKNKMECACFRPEKPQLKLLSPND